MNKRRVSWLGNKSLWLIEWWERLNILPSRLRTGQRFPSSTSSWNPSLAAGVRQGLQTEITLILLQIAWWTREKTHKKLTKKLPELLCWLGLQNCMVHLLNSLVVPMKLAISISEEPEVACPLSWMNFNTVLNDSSRSGSRVTPPFWYSRKSF